MRFSITDLLSGKDEDCSHDGKYRLPMICFPLALAVGLILSAALAPRCSNKALQLLVMFMPFQLFALAAALSTLVPTVMEIGFKKTFDIKENIPSPGKCAVLIVASLLFAYPCTWILNTVSEYICTRLDIPVIEQSFAILPENADIVHKIVLFTCATIMAPVSEEILFRLVTYKCARSFLPMPAAAAAASALFAIAHCTPQLTLSLFLMGMLFQIMRNLGGLPLAIALHCIFNGISLCFMQ